MAQRVEVGNMQTAQLMKMAMQVELPASPPNNNGGMYEKKIAIDCRGSNQKVL
jgi:hypothetical protein